MKRIIALFVLFSFFLLSWTIFNIEIQTTLKTCPFCDPDVLKKQSIYEDDFVIGLLDHRPFLPGHVLIIPKRHIERFESMTEKEIAHIGKVIKKVDLAVKKIYKTSSYLILQKNGREVGQTVPHLHFHYIPRKQGHFSTLPLLIYMYCTPFRKPMKDKELKWQVSKIKELMS